MYRLAFTAVVIKWQNVATFLHMASRQVAKAILSFLGLIVQSAIIDESELSKLAYEWPSERRNLLNGLKTTRANRNRVGCCCAGSVPPSPPLPRWWRRRDRVKQQGPHTYQKANPVGINRGSRARCALRLRFLQRANSNPSSLDIQVKTRHPAFLGDYLDA